MVNRRDPRVDGWFLMSSPLPVTAICASYIVFAKQLGPRLMRDRPAFDFRKTILLYNFVQVLASVLMVCVGWRYGWSRYSFRCQPIDYSTDNLDEMVIVHLSWWYFFNKIVELLDTVFFIARKKLDQVSNLHVIHHAAMPFFTWWVVKFTAGGHPTFIGLVNNFIHSIMYSYYFLAALGPQLHKYLWWKKYLTSMQIAQFVMVFIHQTQLFFIECNVPKIMTVVFTFNTIVILCLFTNFYVQAYIKGRRLSPDARRKKDDGQQETVEAEPKERKTFAKSVDDEQSNSMVNRMLRFHTPERLSRS